MQNGDEEEYEEMPEWVRLGREVPGLANAPFSLWFKTFKSSSDEAEAFIHDPRRFVTGQTVANHEGVKGAILEGVSETTRIVTLVTNHERTLQRKIIYTLALVAPGQDTTTFEIYKQDADA